MEIRQSSISSIQYVTIHRGSMEQNPILFASTLTNGIFNLLMHFPHDFMQFHDPKRYFEISQLESSVNPAINVLAFEDKEILGELNPFALYSDMMGLRERVVVYFIDANTEHLETIKSKINQVNHKAWYYSYHAKTDTRHAIFEPERYFESVFDLIELFKRDFKSIKKMFSNVSDGYLDLEFDIDFDPDTQVIVNFNPNNANLITLRQITKDKWKLHYPKNVTIPENGERNRALLDCVKKIDDRHIEILNDLRDFGVVPKLPIIVLTFPFFNPTTNNLLAPIAKTTKQKLYLQLFSLEQDIHYLNTFESKQANARDIGAIVLNDFVKPKMSLLDGIAYLHSSFNFSPVMRFPLIGKSIFTLLSFFDPKNKNFDTVKAKRNVFTAIRKFGNKLASHTLEENTKEYLKQRNGQILAISDLPVEWLIVDDVPLGFTHDVCRIPEANYQGIINNYSANNRFSVELTENTLSKTLIILSADGRGSKDHEFHASYTTLEEVSKTADFVYRYCSSIEEVTAAVKEIEPEILIFDCHGDIDKTNQTSYLIINKQKLTGAEIVKHNISAPIIFLSCCNTSPNYAYINKLHDAFFQAGAITVTGTFLPISIKRGTVYYIRLLSLLKVELSKKLFVNWLSFISHVIRTSFIHDAMMKSGQKLRRLLTDEEKENLSKLLFRAQVFSTRRDLFLELQNSGIEISKELKISLDETECEFLMYTHYGRPDLITWK